MPSIRNPINEHARTIILNDYNENRLLPPNSYEVCDAEHATEIGKGYLTNCFIKQRQEEAKNNMVMFEKLYNGMMLCFLDRYAIIPIEEYNDLVKNQRTGIDTKGILNKVFGRSCND